MQGNNPIAASNWFLNYSRILAFAFSSILYIDYFCQKLTRYSTVQATSGRQGQVGLQNLFPSCITLILLNQLIMVQSMEGQYTEYERRIHSHCWLICTLSFLCCFVEMSWSLVSEKKILVSISELTDCTWGITANPRSACRFSHTTHCIPLLRQKLILLSQLT